MIKIKIETLKKVKKNFDEIYNKEINTKQVTIRLENGANIFITEQQVGLALAEPHVEISTQNGFYRMDWNVFIDNIKRT